MSRRISSRARLHDDRAGDPLDGLVNLFDVGVVLAVAFLLAALASLELKPSALGAKPPQPASAADTVVVRPGERTRRVRLRPGERAIGRGERLGAVYRLADGRTILVRPGGARP